MSTHKTTVLLSELKAIKTFASIDASRFVLIGVSCEIHEDKTLLVATDGKRLAVLRSLAMPSDSKPVTFTIPSHLLARMTHAKRKAKPGENDITIEYDSDSRAVSLGHCSHDYTITGKSLEGSFPNWRGVIPKLGANQPNGAFHVWSVNASYLGDMLAVGRAMGLREPHVVAFRQSDPLGPIEARFAEADNFYAVIMPIKVVKTPEQFDWLKQS